MNEGQLANEKIAQIYRDRCPKCGTTAVYKIERFCTVCWWKLSDFQKYLILKNADKIK
jgi:predicted amidophosphoribosyltransferase